MPIAAVFAFAALANVAYANDRFTLESATLSPLAGNHSPARDSGTNPRGAVGQNYRIDGAILGVSDAIFSDGFESARAWDVTFTGNVPVGGVTVVLGSIDVPAGSYVAFARLQALTGSEAAPANNYRFDCQLSTGFDGNVSRVGMQSDVERYLAFQGAARLASAGTIRLSCRDGNNHTNTVLSGKLTVLTVDTVN